MVGNHSRSAWARFRLLMLFSAMAVAVSACSGGDQSANSATEGYPLAVYMGFDSGSSGIDDEAFRQRQLDIADCMAERGFDYFPREVGEIVDSDAAEEGVPPYGSDEWIEQFGLGIITSLPVVAEGDDFNYYAAFSDSDDPNTVYFDGLDAPTQEAYREAIGGSPSDPSDYGCSANITLYPEREEPPLLAYVDAFGERLVGLRNQIDSDRAVVDDEARSASCLSNKAVEYGTADELLDYLYSLAEEVEGATQEVPWIHPYEEEDFAVQGEELRIHREREVELGRQELEAIIKSSIDEELRLVQAFVECDATVPPLLESEIYRQTRTRYEQDFIDNNSEELGKYRIATDES